MSDRKRDREKKEKPVEKDNEFMEIPMHNMQNYGQPQMCPMLAQCPMAFQCPLMQAPNVQEKDMRIKDWYDEWDESSEDDSFEFDSDDFYLPEKYYKKHIKKHKHPLFWAPYFPYYKK